jgi:hypothetical protein
MAGKWDIRLACKNHLHYLRDAVEMLSQRFPDINVHSVDNIGPCVYRTVLSTSIPSGYASNQDYRGVALAVSRINEFIRNVEALLHAYGWRVFEKESYVDGDVYMVVTWIKWVRIPHKEHATLMDIYELALPYIAGSGSASSEGSARV